MMTKAHSILGASSAHRWLECPGSVRLSADIPKTSSVYADEGTAAHALAEKCLQDDIDAASRIGTVIVVKGNTFTVTEEMAEAVQVYLDVVRADYNAAGDSAELRFETKFHLDWLYDGLFGTNDAMVGQPFGTLYVYDYKHGAGVPVDVVANPQMLYYGLGAIKDISTAAGYEDVELVVVQPRAPHPDGPVRRWRVTVDDLMRWGKEVLLPGAQATENKEAKLSAGSHCKFCPALAVCPAQKALVTDVAKQVFAPSPAAPPAPETLTPADLKKILDVSDLIDAWLNACRAYVQTAIENGRLKPEDVGYKLVQGRATRKWTDEKEAEEFLLMVVSENEAYTPRKVLSPAQAEKLLKGDAKKTIAGMVTETRGTQLAPLSDKREAIQPAIAVFEEVEL